MIGGLLKENIINYEEIYCTSLLLITSLHSFSQANEDDINALSIFSEYVKAKNYDAAFQPWMELRAKKS